MNREQHRHLLNFVESIRAALVSLQVIAVLFLSSSSMLFAQNGSSDGEWPSYAADAGSTKYTSLSQINSDNFSELEIAWRWASIDADLDLENSAWTRRW